MTHCPERGADFLDAWGANILFEKVSKHKTKRHWRTCLFDQIKGDLTGAGTEPTESAQETPARNSPVF